MWERRNNKRWNLTKQRVLEAEIIELRKEIRAAQSIRVRGTGTQMRRSPHGTIINVAKQTALLTIKVFRVYQVYDDYLSCYEWDGANLGDELFNVAMPLQFRRSYYVNETWGDDIDYYYTYYFAQARKLWRKDPPDPDILTAYEWIVPRYDPYRVTATETFKGSVIWAAKMTTLCVDGSNNAIEWLDLNLEGRGWCA